MGRTCDLHMVAMSQISGHLTVCSTVYPSWHQKEPKIRVSGFCEGNSPATSGFPSQRAINAEKKTLPCHDVIMIEWGLIQDFPRILHTVHSLFCRTESCYDAYFVVTGGTRDCHYDNLQCLLPVIKTLASWQHWKLRCHDANFVIAGRTWGSRNVNHQLQKSSHLGFQCLKF